MDYGAIGHVTNLAARLCDESQGGAILVDQDTLDRIADRSMPNRWEACCSGDDQPIAVARVRAMR